jgi:opacity protein-like surface antigen
MEYQVAQRWFVGARYDYSGFPDDAARKEQAGSLLLRFQPTEFQILALEYQYTDRNYDRNTSQVVLRFIFGIGTHAAHQY